MLTYEEMPEDNADLAKVEVSFPYLADNTAASSPVKMKKILSYLKKELADEGAVEIEFLRTAQVAEKEYWLWRFTDSGDAQCYLTVSRNPKGETGIGYAENYYELSPEQFLLGDYHQVF